MTLYRRAWTMQLCEGAEAAYDAAHAAIWPELQAHMQACGIVRFFLYRSGRTIFAFQERNRPFPNTSDPPSEVMVRWWSDMAQLMETEGDHHRPIQRELREVLAYDPAMLADR